MQASEKKKPRDTKKQNMAKESSLAWSTTVGRKLTNTGMAIILLPCALLAFSPSSQTEVTR